MNPRSIFGALAFIVTGGAIALALSPWVASDKEQISLVVLGNVLSWPVIILQWYFGSSEDSKEKTHLLTERPAGRPGDPVSVEED